MEQNKMKIELQKMKMEQKKTKMEQQKMKMKQNRMQKEQQKMSLELQKGVWCGYKLKWNTANAKITYDYLLYYSTNIKNPGIGLNTQSGIIAYYHSL